MNIVVFYGEVLKVKSNVLIYTKKCEKDEECVGSSYHVTT